MPIVNGQVVPATGRAPATGLAFQIPPVFAQLPTSPFRFPFSTEQPKAPLRVPPRYSLPEQPLKPSPLFGAENLAFAAVAIPVLRTLRESYRIAIGVRKATLYYGKLKIDAPFYAALFASGLLAQKFEELENQILGIPLPSTTVSTGSVLSNIFRPEPTQLDLQNAFNRAVFGPSADVSREFAIRRRFADQFGAIVNQPVGFTREEKILEAFIEGLQFRPLAIAQSEIAASRTLNLIEFVNQMNLVGVFSGNASGGVMPGERGDP